MKTNQFLLDVQELNGIWQELNGICGHPHQPEFYNGFAQYGGPYWCEPYAKLVGEQRDTWRSSKDRQELEVRRCDKCNALCDNRIQVCECTKDCPYPPISR